MSDVEDWRAEIPAVAEEGLIHLNNCSAGPVPQRGLDARRECERVWIEEPNPWGTWLAKVEAAKDNFADIIGARPEEIAVCSGATDALARLASAFDYEDRDGIVVSDLEFPTVPQFWHGQEGRGARVSYATSPDGIGVPVDAYADAVDDDTLLVSTSHARSFTGSLLDVEGVAEVVHDRGGYLVLDAYQSAGVVPIDVDAMGVDALVAGTLKFLLGGPGIAFLYVDDAVVEDLEPTARGWFGADDIFGFDRDPDYAAGARRFELGTPPATVAYQAAAGMDLIHEVGVDRIRERVVRHTGRLIEGVEERGFSVRTPRNDDERGGVVNVQVADPGATEEAMLDAGFAMSTRAGGIRLAPHFYTTDDEIDAAIEAIDTHATPTT
ncbi:MAG TPA: aminotransferase class V-fold PLP-dependent enzyme [Natrialbaceae archaeon]|nr:aminotransferase class V-fold PLP-dependent enzyme [Natrialbaceae archaeon]